MMLRPLIAILLIALCQRSWAQGDRTNHATAAVQAWYKIAGSRSDSTIRMAKQPISARVDSTPAATPRETPSPSPQWFKPD